MNDSKSRQINFEAIYNFRDLGGYQTNAGHEVAWRKLFRSGELQKMTTGDAERLKQEIGLVSVLDLRSNLEIDEQGIGLISTIGLKYFNISFISDGGDREGNIRRYQGLANMGEFYLRLLRQKEFAQLLIEALTIIANPKNQPLVFHCSAGKDRTGLLSAIVLSILGVSDEDIADDYFLTASHPHKQYNHITSEMKKEGEANGLPEFFWEITAELMLQFLSKFREEYGSIVEYLQKHGADSSLIPSLKQALIVKLSVT
jgi:protein-tyrosine phosphatase